MTNSEIVLCTDLDRTVIPNGAQPESPEARPRLRRLAARPEATLVYVTGRHKALLEDAIRAYDLPVPDYAIGDVGTTIYQVQDGAWRPWRAWSEEIASDWQGHDGQAIAGLLADLDGLHLQEPEKQNDYKLSYYAPAGTRPDPLLAEIRERLEGRGIRASLIWSVDEAANCGLVDVLPAAANKLHAIRFLMRKKGFSDTRTVFSGDSGNDLEVLVSGLQAVLVRNAPDDVREEAMEKVAEAGYPQRLYVARGGFLGMNGHYSAGVLEGLVHFLPHTVDWLEPQPVSTG